MVAGLLSGYLDLDHLGALLYMSCVSMAYAMISALYMFSSNVSMRTWLACHHVTIANAATRSVK